MSFRRPLPRDSAPPIVRLLPLPLSATCASWREKWDGGRAPRQEESKAAELLMDRFTEFGYSPEMQDFQVRIGSLQRGFQQYNP